MKLRPKADAPAPGGMSLAESALVARVREGDRDAFDALVRGEVAGLLSWAYRQVGSRAVAEELVQDVLFNIWKSHETWRVPGTVQAYLYRAVRNRVYNVLEHERVARRWEARELARPADVASGPDESLIDAESESGIARAVSQLPQGIREVVELRRTSDLTHPQIAHALGVSVKTVEKRIAKARALLRRLLPLS